MAIFKNMGTVIPEEYRGISCLYSILVVCTELHEELDGQRRIKKS